jgi:hypothetical protein
VRKVTAATGIITTVAGNGTSGFSGDGGPATKAQLFEPTSVAVDRANNLYIADYLNHRIRKVSADTGLISTIVGTGKCAAYPGDGVLASASAICTPQNVAIDDAGNLYLDSNSYVGTGLRVLKVSAATGTVTAIAGTGALGGCDAGGGPALKANLPSGGIYLTADGPGNVYIGGSSGECIHRVDADSGILRLIAGTGLFGFTGDNGPATSAQLNDPLGLSVSSIGVVYFADALNNRIRVLTPNYVSGNSLVAAAIPFFNPSRNSAIGLPPR